MSTKKLQLIIICIYLGMMLVFSGIVYRFYDYVQESTSQNVINNQEEVTKQIAEQVDTFLDTMDNVALQVMGNEVLHDGFKQTDDNQNENWFEKQPLLNSRLQNALMKINGPGDAVERISVYNHKQDYISFGNAFEKESMIKEGLEEIDVPELIESISKTPHSKRKIMVHEDYWGPSQDMISVYRILMNATTSHKYGVIEVQRPLDKLEQDILLKNQDEMELFVYDADGIQILPARGQRERAASIIKMVGGTASGLLKGAEKESEFASDILTWNSGGEYGWKVVAVQSKENLQKPMKDFRNFVILGMLLFSCISIGFFIMIIKKILMPIRSLSDSVNKVSYSNLELKINDLKGDEVENINQAFQTMFERLKVSIDSEIKSNLWAMQAQMNPHFLYNTLSVISAAGIEEDSEKVPFLCEKLSNMLRYSSSYEERVAECTAELSYVRDYLALMNERYGDRIQYEIVQEGEIQKIKVPKISIQPFVENCFKHGFQKKPFPWSIKVRVTECENKWEISVEDNGCGITSKRREELEERIKHLEENLSELSSVQIGGMGLTNTVIRFRLICKGQIHYEIGASPMGGMKIVIKGDADD